MSEKIKKYIDDLFAGISETRQVRELKEEIISNLTDKYNEYISKGIPNKEAINKSVSSLGDIDELLENLKKFSEEKVRIEEFKTFPISKKQAAGYITGVFILLIGLMLGGIEYLMNKNIFSAVEIFIPFVLLSVPIFIFFGLVQETAKHYPMNKKRALAYSLSSLIFLISASFGAYEYFFNFKLIFIFSTFMPFLIVSATWFVFLGLTEKKRNKINPEWIREWIDYYKNPKIAVIRGSISGALWVLSIGAYFAISLAFGWKFSWIIFVIVIALEILIEAFFASRKR